MAIFNATFVIRPSEKQRSYKKVLNWLKKHKSFFALMLVFLMFAMLLAFIILIECQLLNFNNKQITNESDENNLNRRERFLLEPRNEPSCDSTKSCYPSGTCTHITCKNMNIDDVIEFLNKYDEVELLLTKISFPDNIITKVTLSKIKANVRYLSFIQCNIIDIEECAFSFDTFSSLTYLVMSDVNFNYLEKRMLCGLRVSTFEFKFNDFKLNFKFERGLLDDWKQLESLQIQRCLSDAESIVNITGSSAYFKDLLGIDFRYNPLTSLESNTFISAPNVQKILLDDSSLEYVDEKAFSNLCKLSYLTLNNNRLRTLKEEVLSNLNLSHLTLHDNPWQCDCNLLWLKDYHKKDFVAKECITCYNLQESIDTGMFCEDFNNQTMPTSSTSTSISTSKSTSISTSTSTSTDTSVSDENPNSTSASTSSTKDSNTNETPAITTTPKVENPTYKEIDCKDLSYDNNKETLRSERRKFESIRIPDDNITLELFENDEDEDRYKVTLLIKHDNNFVISKYILMWFNYDDNDPKCYTKLRNEMVLDGIERGTTYTLCLLDENQQESTRENNVYSPRHCRGLTTPQPWKEQPWIKNDFIDVTIGIIIIVIIITIILTTLITYICIRKYPNLIKGSKKIIVIKEKDSRQYNQSQREFDRPAYADPSLITYDRGYLTPNFHKYSRIKYKPPLHTNPPNSGFYSDNEIYIQADEPTRFQLETWRMNIRKRPRLDHIYNTNRIDEGTEYDEIPPPIPSGHPYGRSKKSTYSMYNHNLYSVA